MHYKVIGVKLASKSRPWNQPALKLASSALIAYAALALKPIVAILNPVAAAGTAGQQAPALLRQLEAILGPIEVRVTERPRQATFWTRETLRQKTDLLVAIGGDGTLNEVVNGFFAEDGSPLDCATTLVALPLGTGSDFARSAGIDRGDVQWLRTASSQRIDVGRLRSGSGAGLTWTHFLNVSSFGSSAVIADRVRRVGRRRLRRLAFLIEALRALPRHRACPVRLRMDDRQDQELTVHTAAIANARYFGGGMHIAPQASLTDGRLELVVVSDLSPLKFLWYAPRLYRGTHLNVPGVSAYRGRSIEVVPLGSNTALVEADGQLCGELPARWDVLPGQLRLLLPHPR